MWRTNSYCSKALRRGELYENDSEQKLIQEVGDVYAMIDLLVEWDVSWEDIEKQEIRKEKLKSGAFDNKYPELPDELHELSNQFTIVKMPIYDIKSEKYVQ